MYVSRPKEKTKTNSILRVVNLWASVGVKESAFGLELCFKEAQTQLIHLFMSPIHLVIAQYLFTALPEADEQVCELSAPYTVQVHSIQSLTSESFNHQRYAELVNIVR